MFFDKVSHVTHIENAISILQRGKILPQLVYDESKLNEDRILVNWLSPNYWTDGFRYGNVSFNFDFRSLIEGKNLYWVESIKYNTPALRILITAQDRSSDKRLIPYDPGFKTGPWWYDTKAEKNYRNSSYTLEFMLEEELNIEKAKSISFVEHHPNHCCVDRERCKDMGMNSRSAMQVLGAGAILHGLNCASLPFDPSDLEMLEDLLHNHHHASKKKSFLGENYDKSNNTALVLAWLSAVYFRRIPETRTIRQLFSSADSFFFSIAESIENCFGPNKFTRLKNPD